MSLSVSEERLKRSDFWYFEPEKWPIYRGVIKKAQERGIPFAMGGGFAQMAYTGWPRAAKDVDIFLLPRDREAMIAIVTEEGLHDYYDEKPYDRGWIYRSTKDDVIVDVIWTMANRRAEVDCGWIERGPEIAVDGARFRLMPAEELLWIKLYIMQRDRSDWPDALNLLYTRGLDLDWTRVLQLLGDDRPLLGSLLSLFSWLCPNDIGNFPQWLWGEIGVQPECKPVDREVLRTRANWLDSRPWFIPAMDANGG
jgi:hypothetical protein